MEHKRKIERVVTKGSFAEAEEADEEYWAEKTIAERLTEMLEWNKKVWPDYPEVIEKVGRKVLKSEAHEDDF